jgi:hypothetical protein
VSLNAHYEAVLADLRQMKADAEDGIRAILRLMSRSGVASSSAPSDNADVAGAGSSLSNRIIGFLDSQQGRSCRAEDIAKAIGAVNIKTMRATLFRLAKSGKIGRHGRGKYRCARKSTANTEIMAA